MRLKVFGAILAVALLAAIAGGVGWIAGMNSKDEPEVEAQAAASTPTAAPSMVPFCKAISDYLVKTDESTKYFNDSLSKTPISQFSTPQMQTYRDMVRAANNIAVPLAPLGASSDASALYEAVRAHQSSADRQASAVFGRDAELLRLAIDSKNAARRDIDAYRQRIC